MGKMQDDRCPICLEDLKDARMMPCWHRACFICILANCRNGEGQAVSCSVCRQATLFENVRFLPEPITCNSCGGFDPSPRAFPCCDRVLCSECIKRTAYGGVMRCQSGCLPDFKHAIVDLPTGKICPVCYALHTEPPRLCGHSTCTYCYLRTSQTCIEDCLVCDAMMSMPPLPANASGYRLAPFARRFPPIQPEASPLCQLTWPMAWLTAICMQEDHHHRQVWTPLEQKMLCSLVAFIAILFVYGFDTTTVLVSALALNVLNIGEGHVVLTIAGSIIAFIQIIYYFTDSIRFAVLSCVLYVAVSFRTHWFVDIVILIAFVPIVSVYFDPMFLQWICVQALAVAIGLMPDTRYRLSAGVAT